MIFGIIAMLLVGISWIVWGYVAGVANRRKLNMELMVACSAALGAAVSLPIALGKGLPDFTSPQVLVIMGWIVLGGILNFAQLQFMNRAMNFGPNGIIWAIIQSAMIFPFLTGILFFGVKANFIRIMGMVLLLISLALSGLSRPNKTTGNGRWKMLAFAAFIITGFVHNFANIPSYFESVQRITPYFRSLMGASGAFIAAFLLLFFQKKTKLFIENTKSKWLWIFSMGLQFFSLIFAIYLFYPGMDTLARCGAGSLSYPLLVSSCLIGFFFYSLLVLKERNTPLQYASLACCLTGIVMICL